VTRQRPSPKLGKSLVATNAVERQAEEKILKTFAQVNVWHTARRFTPVPVTGPLDVVHPL
jgi:hypothetical protein